MSHAIFTRTMTRTRLLRPCILAAACAALLTGCAGSSNQNNNTTQLDPTGVFGPMAGTTQANTTAATRNQPAPANRGAARNAEVNPAPADITPTMLDSGNGWAILLERFPGTDQLAVARSRLPYVQRTINRTDLAIRAVESGYAIVLGSYGDPGEAEATQDLNFVRSLRTPDGRRPYAGAWIVPPRNVTEAGSRPEFNLAYAKRRWPSAAYTLQIEVYWPPEGTRTRDLAKFQRAAEERAFELRQQGELAFYFHGRTRSMVTVGLFTEADYDEDGGLAAIKSQELRALKERHPYNLVNGRELWETTWENGEKKKKRQRSMPVYVP